LVSFEIPVDAGELRAHDGSHLLLLILVQNRLTDLGGSRTRELMSDLKREGLLNANAEGLMPLPSQFPSLSALTDRGRVLLKVVRGDGEMG
jgi:hypothetical protein